MRNFIVTILVFLTIQMGIVMGFVLKLLNLFWIGGFFLVLPAYFLVFIIIDEFVEKHEL